MPITGKCQIGNIGVIKKERGSPLLFVSLFKIELKPVLQILALDDTFPASPLGFHFLDSGDIA